MRKAFGVGVCLLFGVILGCSTIRAENSPERSMSPAYSRDIEIMLFDAVKSRLGIPYRSGGVDDRGYDCSGFVWRVFQDAGIDFERTPARVLWEMQPPADPRDESRFGTLVFFSDLGHVGIVRDSTSFYHASTSQGVMRSYFDKYWAERIVGYRRVYIPAAKGAQKNPLIAEKAGRKNQALAAGPQRHDLRSIDRRVQIALNPPVEKPAKKKRGFFGWLWR